MGAILRVRRGKDRDLGGMIEFLHTVGELGAIIDRDQADDTYPMLLDMVSRLEEEWSQDDAAVLQAEAESALEDYRDELSDHAVWVLEQLAGQGGDEEGEDEGDDEDDDDEQGA